MNDETRAVVEAVLEALDIPYAATNSGAIIREHILAVRLMETVVMLRAIHRGEPIDHYTAYLRDHLTVLDYVTAEQARERVAEP